MWPVSPWILTGTRVLTAKSSSSRKITNWTANRTRSSAGLRSRKLQWRFELNWLKFTRKFRVSSLWLKFQTLVDFPTLVRPVISHSRGSNARLAGLWKLICTHCDGIALLCVIICFFVVVPTPYREPSTKMRWSNEQLLWIVVFLETSHRSTSERSA